ncbi:sporulation initiation inhibitor protein Soj [Clostridium tepidiprofundi DSM 19306]|uniref:Sporulation initiation inhibitor protein Soj n=1 Tax=Clostridium tepidiprofundi DSM 19306 TaxID=1121338 RepID=A0A151B2V7_9CLOT|nr:ParA family protein [Clostridium tepidiprofundi]KYH34113.1 sporulation initiation inhibitor protein Soj [Clostridium tepidiprofundi DSM 19306]
MKKICIFNQKGGVGKTTISVNLSTCLAMEGYNVLVIDIDPQGNTTSGLGINKNEIDKSIYDVITGDEKLDDVIIKSQFMSTLHIAPSTVDLAGAEVELIEREKRELILRNKIQELEGKFDFIFIDCPPSLSFLTVNALTACDSVLIPIQCEFYALEGVGQLVNTIQLIKKSLNRNIEIEGVIISMYDARTNLSNDVVEEVRKYFKEKVYENIIPRNIKLAESPSHGLPIMLYDSRCRGAQAFEKLTKEFLDKQ